ncbi:MAG: glycosyltransferase family 4 protein [Bacillota bacterium]
MKQILMINTLPIINFDKENNKKSKTAGNQTLYNTLKGYSDNGIKVTMVTFFDVPKESTPFPNVTMRRSCFYTLFNILMKLKKAVSSITGKSSANSKSTKVTTEVDRSGSSFFAKCWNVCAYFEGLYLAKKLKPELIYGYEIYSTKPAKRLADKLNLPCVTRFQGTELGFFLDSDKFYKAKDFVDGTAVDSDLIIMANDGTDGHEVLRKLDLDESKVRFWVNGLHDKDKYINFKKDVEYKRKMNLPEDAFVICTANRFVDWKRIDRIIKMMAELVKTNPNVYLVAIGDGPEKEGLVKLAETLQLKNVIFPGAMEHEDAIYHIANSDLYITLNHSGNLGNSILEALALGTAVCTLKNDSVEKVLKNEYNSVLFDTIDETAIARQMATIINDENKLKTLKYNAREYAKENLLSWSDRMKLEIRELEKLVKN